MASSLGPVASSCRRSGLVVSHFCEGVEVSGPDARVRVIQGGPPSGVISARCIACFRVPVCFTESIPNEPLLQSPQPLPPPDLSPGKTPSSFRYPRLRLDADALPCCTLLVALRGFPLTSSHFAASRGATSPMCCNSTNSLLCPRHSSENVAMRNHPGSVSGDTKGAPASHERPPNSTHEDFKEKTGGETGKLRKREMQS